MSNKRKHFEIGSENIFDDLELEQSDELLARAKLLMQVGDLIIKSGLTQKKAAEKLGISQPKVSMLVSGKLSAFSTDTLLHYLFILGCGVEIRVRKPRSHANLFRRRGHIAVI